MREGAGGTGGDRARPRDLGHRERNLGRRMTAPRIRAADAGSSSANGVDGGVAHDLHCQQQRGNDDNDAADDHRPPRPPPSGVSACGLRELVAATRRRLRDHQDLGRLLEPCPCRSRSRIHNHSRSGRSHSRRSSADLVSVAPRMCVPVASSRLSASIAARVRVLPLSMTNSTLPGRRGEQRRIGQAERRRPVDHDQVEAVRRLGDDLADAAGRQQVGGIGRQRAARQQPQIRRAGSRRHGLPTGSSVVSSLLSPPCRSRP